MRIKNSSSYSYNRQIQALYKIVDYKKFQDMASKIIQSDHDEESKHQWALFCKHIKELKDKNPEKLMLMQAVFCCFEMKLSNSDLAQFIALAVQVKEIHGVDLYRLLLEAAVPPQSPNIQEYLEVFQLLIDLSGQPGVSNRVKKMLPDLKRLSIKLHEQQSEYLAARYPKRNIDEVIERFATANEITPFPMKREELAEVKIAYLSIEKFTLEIRSLPQTSLASMFHVKLDDRETRTRKLAIAAETIRRIYGITPYDTQMIALLGLLIEDSSDLKGRLAQVRTGEGKTTIFAILIAFIASSGKCVDVVTPNSYLAIRDCEKYAPFYQALGISVSHISYTKQLQRHFDAQILYGTNSNFEFAILRDGLNKEKLRYYHPSGEAQLKPRPFDVVVVDEVDSMLLDGQGSAIIGLPNNKVISWIYKPILDFVTEIAKKNPVTQESVTALRAYLSSHLDTQQVSKVSKLPDAKLTRLLSSAKIACYQKMEMRDYIVTTNIEIVDYANTGRIKKGSQWQHGIHQFLQAKHNLEITPESLTGASISHPTFFGTYKKIYGLTGTMGDDIEREEIQSIYKISSFDVPPHLPNLRKTLPALILPKAEMKMRAILDRVIEVHASGRPILVIFESIIESDIFSKLLHQKRIYHQLLNETQRESEDYIIARAGDLNMVTVATNTAGRGTDIVPTAASREAGGLYVIGALYCENLRVEGQLFGRAGRQGQPGDACLIIDIEEPFVASLLESNRYLPSYDKWEQALSDNERIAALNQFRTNKIFDDSMTRRSRARLESLAYKSLKEFFILLQSLHLEFSTENFQQEMMRIVNSEPHLIQISTPINEKEKSWAIVNQSARNLIEQQRLGKTVDWTSFIDEFKEAFIESLLHYWGNFYSKMSDRIQSMRLYEAIDFVKDAFLKLELAGRFNRQSALDYLVYTMYKASLPSSELHHSHSSGNLRQTFFQNRSADLNKPSVGAGAILDREALNIRQ